MSKRALAASALVVVVLVAALVLANRSSTSDACASPVEDPLDPRSLQHSLGGPPPSYGTEPPTSGPHQAGGLSGGVVAEPIPGPVQVGALEAGQVLLQHRDLSPAELERLEALAGPLVVVAPGPALPTRVAASAWRKRQLCQEVDAASLARFVDQHAGRRAEHGS